MAYARDDIDKVRERTDLAELAAEVTKVKRTGRSVMAVCPFHNEKTPSLSIDAARGLYHCFGCGKGGDVFQWVQETQNVDFVGAVELLARRAGVALTEDPSARRRRSQREALVAATEAAVAFYHERLKSGSDAGAARSYLRGRGYDLDIIEEYQIGYSPDSWDALVNHLSGQDIRRDIMIQAGLASKSRHGRPIDRFRNRIMFPIYDLRGDAVGFGARLLDGEGAKYLNTSETPIYHKSRLLYGLNFAKSEIVRRSEAVVVEGYTDVIAFRQAGHPVAVATCGTALGEEHLDVLRRFTDRVVLAFDADEAGANAALRGFEKAVPGDLELRVAALPPGRDPADLVRAGERAQLEKAVEESIPLLEFRIEQELAKFDLSEAEGRARAVRSTAALIRTHPDGVVRHEYAVLLSRRTGVDLGIVERAVGRPEVEVTPLTDRQRPLTGLEKVERELLRLVLANDSGVRRHEIDPSWFGRAEHRTAYEAVASKVAELAEDDTPDLGRMLAGDDGSHALLRTLAMVDSPLADADELVVRLKVGAVERRIETVREKLSSLDPDGQEYSDRLGELIALEREKRQLRSHE